MDHPSIQRIREITGHRPYRSGVMDFLESGGGMSQNITKLHREQKKIINFIDQNKRSAVIARRRIGLSTAVLGYMIHDFLSKQDQLIAITASNSALATQNYMQFRGMVMHKMSPLYKVVKNTRTDFELNNGSRIFVANGEHRFRGLSCTHIFHDNFLGDNKANEKFQTYIVISNAKIIIGTNPRSTDTAKLIKNSYLKTLQL